MKKQFIAIILASMMVSPLATAAGGYGGLSFGIVSTDDVDTGNIGIALGNIAESGFGYEFFYNFTVVDDDDSEAGVEIKAETDIVSLFLVYRTPGAAYLKAKAGYGVVNLNFDIEDAEPIRDAAEGFAYGIAAGISIGQGSAELTYYQFPEFDEFDGVSVDEEVEMINLTYFWTF